MATRGWTALLCWALICSAAAAAPSDPRPAKKHRGRVHNTPDVEVTPKGQWNVSEELNFYAAQGLSNTTVDYGLPSGWNIGFSVLNAGFYQQSGTLWLEPDALFNLEKAFRLAEGWNLIAGTQVGAAFFHTGAARLIDFSYLDSQWLSPRWGTALHLGGYYANAALAGLPRDTFGWHANAELPLIRDKLVLEGDYLSGRNNVGGATVKLTYALTRRWALSLGVQVPASRTGNDYSGLIGVYWRH